MSSELENVDDDVEVRPRARVMCGLFGRLSCRVGYGRCLHHGQHLGDRRVDSVVFA